MRRSVWIMFAGFSLIAASEWLLPSVSVVVRGLVFAVVGIVAAILSGGRGWQGLAGVSRLALAAVWMVGVPEIVAGWGLRHVSSNLWVVVLAVVPAMVVLVVAQSSGDGVRRLLGPALAGLGGVLLIVPLDVPRSVMGWISLAMLVASAVGIAIASVWIHRLSQGFGLAQVVAVFCLANALVLLGWGFFDGVAGWGLSGWGWVAVLAQGVGVVLLVALLRGMSPVRFGARYLVVPLVTVVEGYVLLRPELTLRMGFGALLLAGSAAFLLLWRGVDERAGLSLR
jgi:drug/metabolite transporter (DMT)-like permease